MKDLVPWTLPAVALAVMAAFYFSRSKKEVALDQRLIEVVAPVIEDERSEPAAIEKPDGAALLAEIAGELSERATELGPGQRHSALWDIDAEIRKLDADLLIAIIGQDPELSCAKSHVLEGTPLVEWIQANFVWAAVVRLFEIDPIRAVKSMDGVGAASEEIGLGANGTSLHHMICDGLAEWGLSDFDGAWNWISDRMDSIYMPETKMSQIFEGYAKQDFRGALNQAEERGRLEENIWNIARSLATDDDIEAYLEASTEFPRRRPEAAKSIAEKLHNTRGFASARAFYDEHVEGEKWAGDVVRQLAMTHLHEAPVEKAAWLSGVLLENQVPSAMANFVQNWVAIDLPPTANWLKSQPDDAAWKTSAMDAFDAAVRKVDPEAADAWRRRSEGSVA